MRVFHLNAERQAIYREGVLLLPDLETDVLGDSLLDTDLETSFLLGLEDWWDGFVADDYL